MLTISCVKYLCLLVIACMARDSFAAVCPNIPTVANFEPSKFMGKWYEIQKYPNIWEAGQKCITAEYELNPNGTINVINKSLLKLINYPLSIKGLATPNETDSAKLSVSFGGTAKSKLWILATDYTNYALSYSCTPLPLVPINIENAWILSRTPTLDPQVIEQLKGILSGIGSPTFLFFQTDQTNCPVNTEITNTDSI